MADLEPLLTLKDIAPLMQMEIKSLQHKLARGTFPIRHVNARPYRFTRADVEAYIQRGEVTNPNLVPKLPRLFQGAALARRRA